MPVVDMPIGELRDYEGRNPRPLDFDGYWDRALEEMRGVEADVELVPAGFQAPYAECFDLYFTGVRGARIHAKYLRPLNASSCPAVVQFHGYTGNSGEWNDKLGYVSQGYCVAAMDCRGQGGLSEDVGGVKGNTHKGHIIRGLAEAVDGEPDNLLFRHIFLDAAQLAGIVMGFDEVDAGRVGGMGGSQGGALTVACAALEPRIKRASAQFPFLCDYKRVWEMDLGGGAYEELRAYFRAFDIMHEREEDVFTALGYIDVQHLAGRIKAEVLAGCGLMDNICPPSAQFAVYNKIKSTKNILIYPDFAHEGIPGYWDETMKFMLEM